MKLYYIIILKQNNYEKEFKFDRFNSNVLATH